MKIIIANYRYFIAGGPEKYMFKFIEQSPLYDIECIPFSVDYSLNYETPYSKYFIRPRGGRDNTMYADIKLSFKNICGLLRCTIYNFESAKKIRRLIRDTHPDAVYILHEINSLSPSIIRAAKKEGVRVVHRISDFFMFCPRLDFLCGNETCESCIHGQYKKALKRRCVKGSFFATLVRIMAMKLYSLINIYSDVDAYITTCDFTRSKLIKGGIPSEKIITVPTFIDAESISPCYENDGYFLYLGRLSEQKGVIYAVEAMKELKDLPIKLKITGELDNSAYCQRINQIIIDNDLKDTVEFVGFQSGEKLKDTIRNCIAIINPAIWYENMPNTVIEAYAYGKPVIGSDLGSLSEIIIDGETGFLVTPKDSFDIARVMRKLFLDSSLISTIGHNARVKVEQDYSSNKHMEKVYSILEGNSI